ncbi:hypothetical protein DLM45_03210 [Hyphomicrobium methylovorum]|nr:hypothetical protein [Hyphomicrobium methylovorum]
MALMPLIPAVITPLAALPSREDIEAARTAVAKLTPYDVGSRYGQALGAEQICSGTRATTKAHALDLIYTEADLQAFKAQASRIYNAWTKIEHCKIEGDPNQCRIVVDESCAAAISDVGPSGTVLPGLLEGAQAAH